MAVYDINRILVPDAPPEYEDHTRDVHYVPAPCQVACPIGTDAPSYIAHIWDEDYEGAFEAITSTNPFSSICGRVCDAPCEPACRRVDSDGAVQIRNLKRFVMDKLGATYRPPAAPVTRKQSIGIVGAGPAGLVAAHDLCVAGYAVHVYEMTDRLGGMMIWGIPAFRLPPGIIDEDVDRLMQRCPGRRSSCRRASPWGRRRTSLVTAAIRARSLRRRSCRRNAVGIQPFFVGQCSVESHNRAAWNEALAAVNSCGKGS